MFWFPEPATVDSLVTEFLQYEIDFLTTNWSLGKAMLTLLVPVSLFLLAMSFWRKNLWIGLSVIIMIALGKILWSTLSARESGLSIIVPALLGLFICLIAVYWGYKKVGNKSPKIRN